MTSNASANWDDRLPETMRNAVHTEIGQVIAGLPDGASCLATGSLVEGIGNTNSDVDLYVIEAPGAPSRPTAIGIRGARYVDCEYFTSDSIAGLCDKFDDATPEEMRELTLGDFDRYYRIAIAVGLVTSADVAAVVGRFRRRRSCELFAVWAALRAAGYASKAAVEYALGDRLAAALIIREAAAWSATSILAAEGEGYPSLKWTAVKAERRFGKGTPAYLDCLFGIDAGPDDLPAVRDRLRDRLPIGTERSVGEDEWELDERTSVYADAEVARLIMRRRRMFEVTGGLRPVLMCLAEGASWPEAVQRAADELRVAEWELRTAIADDVDELVRAGGLKRAVPDREQVE